MALGLEGIKNTLAKYDILIEESVLSRFCTLADGDPEFSVAHEAVLILQRKARQARDRQVWLRIFDVRAESEQGLHEEELRDWLKDLDMIFKYMI